MRNKSTHCNNKLGENNISITEHGKYRVRCQYQGKTFSQTFLELGDAIAYRNTMEELHVTGES